MEVLWLAKGDSPPKTRIGLLGFLCTKNEEEWVYQSSAKGEIKKNCSTRPSRG